jgi:hypothetical protein
MIHYIFSEASFHRYVMQQKLAYWLFQIVGIKWVQTLNIIVAMLVLRYCHHRYVILILARISRLFSLWFFLFLDVMLIVVHRRMIKNNMWRHWETNHSYHNILDQTWRPVLSIRSLISISFVTSFLENFCVSSLWKGWINWWTHRGWWPVGNHETEYSTWMSSDSFPYLKTVLFSRRESWRILNVMWNEYLLWTRSDQSMSNPVLACM